MPLEEAHRRYQQVQAQIEKLQMQEEKEKEKEKEKEREAQQKQREEEEAAILRRQQQAKEDKKEQDNDPTVSINSFSDKIETKARFDVPSLFIDKDWEVTMEEMFHLSAYQITLHPKDQMPPSSDETMAVEYIYHHGNSHSRNATSTTVAFAHIWKANFPCRILDSHVSPLADCFSIRLGAESIPEPDIFRNSTTIISISPESLSRIQCCATPIISNPIHRILPLPEHDWDEVADYLICYNGQPSVDFSSAAATAHSSKPGIILEDSSVIIAHPEDCHEEALCVMTTTATATPTVTPTDENHDETTNGNTYGDLLSDSAAFRGVRDWKDQSEDGQNSQNTSLCCSLCYQKVGVVCSGPSASFRLYKHRLGLGGGVANFVAHQLRRYAESKAIFTFVVFREGHHPKRSNRSSHDNLWIRTVTWDTRMVSGQGGFQRVVKVIYEIRQQQDDQPLPVNLDDPMSLMWGGSVDLCCLPNTSSSWQLKESTTTISNSNKNGALVRLALSEEEFNSLVRSLRECTYYFPREIENLTVFLKLGQQHPHDEAKMAALPLTPN